MSAKNLLIRAVAVVAAATAVAATAPPTAAQAASETVLFTMYVDAQYKGFSAPGKGSYGDCDWEGYKIGLSEYWKTRVSSIEGHGNCNRIELYETLSGGSASGEFSLPKSFGSTRYNDNVMWVHVWCDDC
jgi:hypothetical protein